MRTDLLKRVTQALLECRTPDGYWEGHLSSSALATATAVTAIATAQQARCIVPDGTRLVRDGVAWLAAAQNADGGWGDTPDSVSNISTTTLVWAALTFGRDEDARDAAASAAVWLARAAGGVTPQHLAAALAARYGQDRTFSVPILTMCAIAGRLGPAEAAWRLIPQLPFELAVLPRRFFGALRLPVVSYALPALISMGLARHRRGRSIPLVSHARELAAARVLRVLDHLQPRNGGFLEAVPLTSFVTMSLVAAAEPSHPAVARGIGFLCRSVRRDGSWPIDTNLATWVTTLSVNALAGRTQMMLDAAERIRIRDWLLAQQWTEEHPYTGAAPGGWAWTDLPGGVPDADDTAGALIALAHLGRGDRRTQRAAAAGVRWLLDLQNRDGGIPTFCRGWGTLPFDRSSTDLTAHALRAWNAWAATLDSTLGTRIVSSVERAVAYLERSQRQDGAFVPLWFGNQREPSEENPVFGTSRVLKGLVTVTGASASRAFGIAERARAWLLGSQNVDGGWGGAPGVPSSIEETAVAVASFSCSKSPGGDAACRATRRGVEWLERATNGFRTFPSSPFGLYFARLWYSETLYPLIFTVDALSQSGAPTDGGESSP